MAHSDGVHPRQLTFGSADVAEPTVDDLSGLLVGPGHLLLDPAQGTRISVVVEAGWRVPALIDEFAVRGLGPSTEAADHGVSVRTGFDRRLDELGRRWTRGALRLPPKGLTLTGGALRLWCIASGSMVEVTGGTAWQLALADDPDSWSPTGAALSAAGLAAALVGPRSDGPAYRLAGARRLRRLAEIVGPAPAGADAWP